MLLKLYIISKCIEVYEESPHLRQVKFLNCSQILGHVADHNYIAFIDSSTLFFKKLLNKAIWLLHIVYQWANKDLDAHISLDIHPKLTTGQ